MKDIFNKSIKTSELLTYKKGITEIAANLKLEIQVIELESKTSRFFSNTTEIIIFVKGKQKNVQRFNSIICSKTSTWELPYQKQ